MLKKEVLPASVADPCRRPGDRSPPAVRSIAIIVAVASALGIAAMMAGSYAREQSIAEQRIQELHQQVRELEERVELRLRTTAP